MLRGYRGIIAAVGLVLASPTYGQERKGDQPQAKGNSPSQFDHIAAPIEKLPKTEAPDRGCQPGQDDRYSDLCAQWKAADAATESASWTFWTFIASLVGLSIGGGTLVAAWLAARWAKKAADHTEAGATAADNAVNETRRIGEAQVRAYLTIKRCQLSWAANETPQFKLHLENCGQSPANKISIRWRSVCGDIEIMGSPIEGEFHEFRFNDGLAAQDKIKIPEIGLLGTTMAGSLLLAQFTVLFDDVFGNICHANRSFYCIIEEIGGIYEMSFADGLSAIVHVARIAQGLDPYCTASDDKQHDTDG